MSAIRDRLARVALLRRADDGVALSRRADDGVAMILVLAWGLLMMGMVLVVSQSVINQIVPSDRSEHSYAALSAAEAGLADLTSRLQVGTITSVAADSTNLALKGWVPVPGGDSDAEFTYAIDGSKSGAVGEVRAYATGRAGGVTRTVEAVLSKRSTLDYVYMSDIETPAPDTPGVYDASTTTGPAINEQQAARILCARHWASYGPKTVNMSTGVQVQGPQRNLRFCKWAGIYSTERLIGKVHTNDIWWLENTSLASAIDAGGITSSCRSTAEGLAPGEVGCPASHRYITNSAVSAGTSTQHQGDTWAPSGTDSTQRNPAYDSILDLPPSPDLLKQRAAESGCIFTGPTRIRFSEEGGIGYMYVTSPDTKKTAAGCDGGDGTTLASPATAQVTKKVALTNFTDLVIYVQDVHASTEADVAGANYDDPAQKYYWEKQNRAVLATTPTCSLKGTQKYPYVIPNDAVDRAYFNTSTSTYKGFPSELASNTSPWYKDNCAAGDLYVQGLYKGAIMLATDSNVVLTSSLRDSSLYDPSATVGSTNYGRPSDSSTSVLGIAAAKFSYIYRPLTSASTPAWVGDWKDTNADNPIFNFALLAIQQCFGSQNYDKSGGIGNNGFIYMWGSIAQKYRCAVGQGVTSFGSSGSGYAKRYKYDWRLTVRTPPYMLELSDEPWGKDRVGEMTPQRQALGATVSYNLLNADDPVGTTVDSDTRRFKLSASPDNTKVTVVKTGTNASVTSTIAGLVVVTYDVVFPDSTREVRRLVTVVE